MKSAKYCESGIFFGNQRRLRYMCGHACREEKQGLLGLASTLRRLSGGVQGAKLRCVTPQAFQRTYLPTSGHSSWMVNWGPSNPLALQVMPCHKQVIIYSFFTSYMLYFRTKIEKFLNNYYC